MPTRTDRVQSWLVHFGISYLGKMGADFKKYFMTTLENMQIKGLTVKLLWAIFTATVTLSVGGGIFYANLKNSVRNGTEQSIKNNADITLLTIETRTDSEKIRAQIDALRNQNRALNIRLTIIEKKLKIENPFPPEDFK